MDNTSAFPSASRPPRSPDPQRLAQDFRTFVSDVEALLGNAKSLSGDGAIVARAKLEEKVMQAKTRIDSARAMAVEQAGQAMEVTEGYVRQEPLKAVAIAAAVGALIGLLIARG